MNKSWKDYCHMMWQVLLVAVIILSLPLTILTALWLLGVTASLVLVGIPVVSSFFSIYWGLKAIAYFVDQDIKKGRY